MTTTKMEYNLNELKLLITASNVVQKMKVMSYTITASCHQGSIQNHKFLHMDYFHQKQGNITHTPSHTYILDIHAQTLTHTKRKQAH